MPRLTEETANNRKQSILAAAKKVFEREGFQRATMRRIAEEASVTTGALYPHFKNKEQIYADLVMRSLDSLTHCLDTARAGARRGKALRTTTLAFFEYFRVRLFEFELGLYTFRGHERGTLGKERDNILNRKLRHAILTLEMAILEDNPGCARQGLAAESLSLFTFLMGALTVFHARRDKSLGYSTRQQVLSYAEQVNARMWSTTK